MDVIALCLALPLMLTNNVSEALYKCGAWVRLPSGLSGILCLRRLSLDYKTLAENDSELSFCLEPFT
ncbi:hypothetical protein, partial [Brucella sp. 191011898]|uniref:hypothetical protein n=1 Tax=Brucella sp. 191011898 TaxID=2730447 RepID=UPI001AEE4EE1